MENKTKIIIGVGLLTTAGYITWKATQKSKGFLNAAGGQLLQQANTNATMVAGNMPSMTLVGIPSAPVAAKKVFGITVRKASGGTAKITYLAGNGVASNKAISFNLSTLDSLQKTLNTLGLGTFKVQNIGGNVIVYTDGSVNTIVYNVNGGKPTYSTYSGSANAIATQAAQAQAQPVFAGETAQAITTSAVATSNPLVQAAQAAQAQPIYTTPAQAITPFFDTQVGTSSTSSAQAQPIYTTQAQPIYTTQAQPIYTTAQAMPYGVPIMATPASIWK